MVRQSVALITCLGIFFLTGCGMFNQNNSDTPETTVAANKDSTGYSKDNIQQSYVYYDGNTYVYDDSTMLEALPEDREYLGEITTILTDKMPYKNFQATCLERGYKLYSVASESGVIYIFNGKTYQKFVEYTPA